MPHMRSALVRLIAFLCLAFPTLAGSAAPKLTEPSQASQPAPASITADQDDAAQLASDVSFSISDLQVTGKRSSEAIANITAKFTITDLPNRVALASLCSNGGAPLLSFASRLAEGLNGKITHDVCTSATLDTGTFVFEFTVHTEDGIESAFYLTPYLLEPNFSTAAELSFRPGVIGPSSKNQVPDGPPSTRPWSFDAPHKQTSHYVMSIPPHWTAANLPADIHIASEYGTIDQTVTLTDGTLTADRQFTILQEQVTAAEIPAFTVWDSDARSKYNIESIALNSRMNFPRFSDSQNNDPASKASEIIRHASDLIGASNFDGAEASLKQAQAIDPECEFLRDTQGNLAAARGDLQAALDDYQNEVQAFPSVLPELQKIADMQLALHHPGDAIATYQRWIAADPENYYPVINLINLYTDTREYDLAAGVADQAMSSLNDDGRTSLQFLAAFATAESNANQSAKTNLAINTILDETTYPEYINFAAGLGIGSEGPHERLEAALRDSLPQFNANVAAPHLFATDQIAATGLLYAIWENLAWLLFTGDQPARLEGAESYARAVWLGRPSPASGRILELILKEEKKNVAALDICKLAVAGLPMQDINAPTGDPDVWYMQRQIKDLEADGVVSTIADPVAEAKAMTIFPLGPAKYGKETVTINVAIHPAGLDLGYVHNETNPQNYDFVQRWDNDLGKLIKLPLGYFPVGSTAEIDEEATFACDKVCTLTLNP